MGPANLVYVRVSLDLAFKVNVLWFLNGFGTELKPQAENDNRRIWVGKREMRGKWLLTTHSTPSASRSPAGPPPSSRCSPPCTSAPSRRPRGPARRWGWTWWCCPPSGWPACSDWWRCPPATRWWRGRAWSPQPRTPPGTPSRRRTARPWWRCWRPPGRRASLWWGGAVGDGRGCCLMTDRWVLFLDGGLMATSICLENKKRSEGGQTEGWEGSALLHWDEIIMKWHRECPTECSIKPALVWPDERPEVKCVLDNSTVSGLVGNINLPFVFKPNNFR